MLTLPKDASAIGMPTPSTTSHKTRATQASRSASPPSTTTRTPRQCPTPAPSPHHITRICSSGYTLPATTSLRSSRSLSTRSYSRFVKIEVSFASLSSASCFIDNSTSAVSAALGSVKAVFACMRCHVRARARSFARARAHARVCTDQEDSASTWIGTSKCACTCARARRHTPCLQIPSCHCF